MTVPLKYAHVERERRFLVADVPAGVVRTKLISDRYIVGTRMRLREVTENGVVTRKLCHKVRLSDGPAEVACTNFYLDDHEWALLAALPAHVLTKMRHMIQRDGVSVAVDEFSDGTLVAEIDDGDASPVDVPEWLAVTADVSNDEAWAGASLARRVTADK